MSGVDIDFKFPDVYGLFIAAREELNLFTAAQIQTNRGMLFDSEGAYNGHQPWAPLKLRVGQILSDRGVLRKSVAPRNPSGSAGPEGYVRFGADEIRIGSKLIYASTMNDGTTKMPGGVMRPVHAQALKIPLPAGKSATPYAKSLRKGAKTIKTEVAEGVFKNQKFIFRKFVRIPARNFTDWNEQDAQELSEALANKAVEVINRGAN
jgi:phage gpG-like protein